VSQINILWVMFWGVVKYIITFILVLFLFMSVHSFVGSRTADAPSKSPTLPALAQTIQHQCITGTFATLNSQKIDPDLYERIWNLCGKEEYARLAFDDFSIRREKFIRQELDERVTLWMVVAITLSGIAMSAIQLIMSYKLAITRHSELTKDTTLSIEKGKIAVKSSIIGVTILVISLALFVVYVKWIYTITETHIAPPQTEWQSGRQLPLEGTLQPVPSLGEQPSTNVLPVSPEPR
jgi:hypothetical protein